MLPSWYNLTMLAAESQQVVWLRFVMFAAGGSRARDEAHLMVSEKMATAIHAAGRLMMGDSPNKVVRHYRSKVKANVRRLSK